MAQPIGGVWVDRYPFSNKLIKIFTAIDNRAIDMDFLKHFTLEDIRQGPA